MQLSQQISGVSFLSLCKRYCLDFHYWKGIEVLTQQISIKWVKYCWVHVWCDSLWGASSGQSKKITHGGHGPRLISKWVGKNTKNGYNGLRDKTCFDLNHLKKFWSAYDIQILHLCFLWNVSSYHKRKVHK